MAETQLLSKMAARPLAEVLPQAALPAPALTAIEGCADPAAAFAALEKAALMEEAARLAAHALPKREAVWWACMCARHTAPLPLPPADLRALEAAEAWVYRGEDAARRQAFSHAQDGNFSTPEAWAAVAAFWSGDSMAPLGQAAVPPAPHLAGTAVIGSVLLAAVRSRPERRAQRLANFLAAAREIAAGGSGRMKGDG